MHRKRGFQLALIGGLASAAFIWATSAAHAQQVSNGPQYFVSNATAICQGAPAGQFDGCPLADMSAEFGYANSAAFVAALTDNGQTTGLGDLTLTPWNAPGRGPSGTGGTVGYPVGASTLSTYKHPDTDPLPTQGTFTQCHYSATASTAKGPKITCQNPAGSWTGLTNGVEVKPTYFHQSGQTLNNVSLWKDWDLSTFGGVCVPIDVKNNVAINFVFINVKSKTDQNCVSQGNVFQFEKLMTGDVVLQNVSVDGNYPTFFAPTSGCYAGATICKQTMTGEIEDDRTGYANLTVSYSYIHDCRARCAGGGGSKLADWSFNYNTSTVGQDGVAVGGLTGDTITGATTLNVSGFNTANGFVTTGATLQDATKFTGSLTLNIQASGTQNQDGTYTGSWSSGATGPTVCATSCTLDANATIVVQHGDGLVEHNLPSGSVNPNGVVLDGLAYYENVLKVPNTQPAFTDTCTAPIYLFASLVPGSHIPDTVTTGAAINNIVVTNKNATSNKSPCGGAGVWAAYNKFTNLIITGNAVDPNGTPNYMLTNPGSSPATWATLTMSGNHNLFDKSLVNAFNQAISGTNP